MNNNPYENNIPDNNNIRTSNSVHTEIKTMQDDTPMDNGINSGINQSSLYQNNDNIIGNTNSLNQSINSNNNSFNPSYEENSVSSSYQPQKKKFPLSIREMILVAIALIGVIIVVIMYWPK